MPDDTHGPLIEITDFGTDRYATLNLIDWWDQAKLRAARVLVIGAGALGNEVLKNLALLGVGYIFLADFDVVEAANLSRSVLFRAADSGRLKVEAAAERIREINPDCKVAVLNGDITQALGLGVYRRVDVVLGCLDNRAARLAVNRACWKVGKVWIDGALDVLMGMVRVVTPPDGACYECTFTEQDYMLVNVRYRCPLLRPEDLIGGRIPTTPTSASIVAAWQVQEAVKLLHGMAVPGGKGIYVNGQTYSTTLITYTPREECFSHQTYERIIELPEVGHTATLGDFLNAAEAALGQPVEGLSLLPDFDVLTTFYCATCDAEEAVYRPYDDVMPDGATCPACKGQRLPTVATRLGRVHQAALGVSLAQMGIPALGVVRVAIGAEEAYFELTGDEHALFKAWRE